MRNEWSKGDILLSKTDYALYKDGSITKKVVDAGVFNRKPRVHPYISATIFQSELINLLDQSFGTV